MALVPVKPRHERTHALTKELHSFESDVAAHAGTDKARRIPLDMDPLWIELVRKIEVVRAQRGLSWAALAQVLGVDVQIVADILTGKMMGSPELHDRIARWMFQNTSFAKARAIKVRSRVAKAEGWPKVKLTLPPALFRRLEQTSKALSMSEAAFAHLAIERLIEQEPTLVTLQQAREKIQEARIAQALAESPALQEILASDEEVLAKIGVEIAPRDAGEEDTLAPTTLQQIAEAKLGTHGPVCEVYNPLEEIVE